MVSTNDHVNELQLVIRQLQGELIDLQVGPCPRCNSDLFVKVPNPENIAKVLRGHLRYGRNDVKYATPEYTWRCFDCHFPSGNWLQQPEHNGGRWLTGKQDALLIAGEMFPSAGKYEITFEPAVYAPPAPKAGVHQLAEGVALSCPAVEIVDKVSGQLKSDIQIQHDYPDLFPL